MAITTNLFKGDRVRLSPNGIKENTTTRVRNRIGTIVSDTLDPEAEEIDVLWDGSKTVYNDDHYAPDELELVPEGENVVPRPPSEKRQSLITAFGKAS